TDVVDMARRVDQRVAAGESLPLAGVPFAVKDNIDVAGIDTTAACPASAYRASGSAYVIDLLLAAGAIVVGKTNLDQFATGLSGTRSPYGSPGCVFNREYISGGSSSGSAVVVAAGVVPLALGSDTAGSGRVPAAFNNLVGFKPTRGRWSSRGLLPACRTLDCITSFTMDAADAALVDRVLTDFDPADPYARRAPSPARSIGVSFRFGVPLPQQLKDLPPEERTLFSAAIQRLQAAGGTAVTVDVSALLEAAQLLYGGPWVAERAAVLEALLESNPGAIHPVVRAVVQPGKGISAIAAFRGFYALQSFARAAEQLWESVDLLLLPTTPGIYRRAELLAEPLALNANLGRYTNFVNLLDMSAISLPAGFRTNSTGFGISLIAPAWDDTILLEIAARYERAAVFPAPPELDLATRTAGVLLAVVGAHLSGMPLNWQLTSREARLVSRTRTASLYRLYAMSGQDPPKPALVHCGPGGSAIEVEIYELNTTAFGSFVAEVPAPLAIGSVTLENGSIVRGFVAEPRALEGALEITAHGGWRPYLAQRSKAGVTSS
ncbi:MAG: allophanate hydrolase, partial [Sinobacteraceae bacterium]|nr:allophanate hydrolase [Nevskiaceae bacterium]